MDINIERLKKCISDYYGTDVIKGQKLSDMTDRHVMAIYSRMYTSGQFEDFEYYKKQYVRLYSFAGDSQLGLEKVSKKSFFDLLKFFGNMESDYSNKIDEDILKKNIIEGYYDRDRIEENYQYTIYDYMEQKRKEGII